MKNPFVIGAIKTYQAQVTKEKFASFYSGLIHPVLSTFWVAKEAEWVCRLFVLDMLEPGEEGIGGMVSVFHKSPAIEGSEVLYTATLVEVHKNKITCQWKAEVDGRLIAEGEQVQKIIDKKSFDEYLESLKK